MCCGDGDKILQPLIDPPEPLKTLLTSQSQDAVEFCKNIWQYKAAFAFTPLGVQLDDRLRHGHRFSPFQIHSEIYHQIGTLEPAPRKPLIYAQHYLYNGEEVTNHCLEWNKQLNADTMRALDAML